MEMNLILPIFVGFILTVHGAFDRSVCPAQVRSYKYLHLFADQCILFVSTTKSWDSARSYCKSLHGDLVTIKNADKQKYILDSLRIDHWNQNQVWIGANDKNHEGQWKWNDGSKVSYQHFADGQGNNHNGGFLLAGGSNEDCALIRRDDGGQWHDYPCSPPLFGIGYKYSFACEFHANLPRHTTTNVDTPAPTTGMPNVETPAPTTQMPNVETPAPTTKMPNVETPAPTTQMPNVETPVPTTQMPNVETPAPTTQMPNVETPAPTTQMPNVETPAPTTQMPNVETPAPTTQMPNVETPAPTQPNFETPPPTAIIGKRRKR